jgi:hypothetical protein
MASFWSDASPVTKAVIVIGGLGFIYLGVAFFAKLPPFMQDEPVQQTRGLPAQ